MPHLPDPRETFLSWIVARFDDVELRSVALYVDDDGRSLRSRLPGFGASTLSIAEALVERMEADPALAQRVLAEVANRRPRLSHIPPFGPRTATGVRPPVTPPLSTLERDLLAVLGALRCALDEELIHTLVPHAGGALSVTLEELARKGLVAREAVLGSALTGWRTSFRSSFAGTERRRVLDAVFAREVRAPTLARSETAVAEPRSSSLRWELLVTALVADDQPQPAFGAWASLCRGRLYGDVRRGLRVLRRLSDDGTPGGLEVAFDAARRQALLSEWATLALMAGERRDFDDAVRMARWGRPAARQEAELLRVDLALAEGDLEAAESGLQVARSLAPWWLPARSVGWAREALLRSHRGDLDADADLLAPSAPRWTARVHEVADASPLWLALWRLDVATAQGRLEGAEGAKGVLEAAGDWGLASVAGARAEVALRNGRGNAAQPLPPTWLDPEAAALEAAGHRLRALRLRALSASARGDDHKLEEVRADGETLGFPGLIWLAKGSLGGASGLNLPVVGAT